MMRAFVAIEISNKEIINSISKFQSEIKIQAKPVEPKNLHFTLQFLGEISEEILEKIKIALKSVKFSSFEVKFTGIGAFPKLKFPRVIWVGTDENGGSTLVELAKKIENVLHGVRAFLPGANRGGRPTGSPGKGELRGRAQRLSRSRGLPASAASPGKKKNKGCGQKD